MSRASSVHSIIQGELIVLTAEARRAAGRSFRIMPEGAMVEDAYRGTWLLRPRKP